MKLVNWSFWWFPGSKDHLLPPASTRVMPKDFHTRRAVGPWWAVVKPWWYMVWAGGIGAATSRSPSKGAATAAAPGAMQGREPWSLDIKNFFFGIAKTSKSRSPTYCPSFLAQCMKSLNMWKWENPNSQSRADSPRIISLKSTSRICWFNWIATVYAVYCARFHCDAFGHIHVPSCSCLVELWHLTILRWGCNNSFEPGHVIAMLLWRR